MIGSSKYGWFNSIKPSFLYYTNFTYKYEILGVALNDYYGTTVAISSGGDIWCTSAPCFNNGSLADAGIIQFYRNNVPFASIMGTGAANYLGSTISINASGNRIVTNKNTASIVYTHTGGSLYQQLGNAIDFVNYSPSHYSMNGLGDIYAVGYNSAPVGGVTFSGEVRIFELISNTWTQRGNTITGLSSSRVGACALNKAGNIIAVGAPYAPDMFKIGSVSAFEWNGISWNAKGTPLYGLSNDRFGHVVALNYEGTRLAVGIPGRTNTNGATGQVIVYDWNGSNWSQLGDIIQAPLAAGGSPLSGNRSFGSTLSLNSQGDVLIIGDSYALFNGSQTGSTHIFQWYNNNWVNYVPTISGGTNDLLGYSVAIDGANNIVVGIPYYDFNGIYQRGRAIYYTLS